MAYDVIAVSKRLKEYGLMFYLPPHQWRACKLNISLSWDFVRFERQNRRHIPKQRGIYAFVVKPGVPETFDHGYLLYIGQAGGSSSRTLYDRYADYMSPSQIIKRPRINLMMANWKDHLYFYFAPIQDRRRNLEAIEVTLNDTFIPPCVEADYSVVIKRAVKVLR